MGDIDNAAPRFLDFAECNRYVAHSRTDGEEDGWVS